MGLCIALSFSSCKSSESAYKKAYEKAKQKELAETQAAAPAEETVPAAVTPVVSTTPVSAPKVVESVSASIPQEKVTVVNASESMLKNYNVIGGSFMIEASANNLRDRLAADGYPSFVVLNADVTPNMYRVVVCSFDDRQSAEQARDAFKARYPGNADFQGAWLLYRIK